MYIGAMKLVLNAAAVVSAGTVYSNSFNIGYGVYFGVRVLASSASGTPSVQIQVEESSVLPATENASDTMYFLILMMRFIMLRLSHLFQWHMGALK
jgi:hypothetical protein